MLFGVDETRIDELQARRTRRRRRLKRLAVTAVELIIAAPLLAALGVIYLTLTPSGVERLLAWARPDADSELTIAGVAVHPASRWDEPSTWKIVLSDLDIVPDDARRPRLHIDHLVLGPPNFDALWVHKELVVREAWLIGLHIQATQQQAAPPRDRIDNAIQRIRAEVVHVWDASYDAPADAPLPPAAVHGIYGELANVVYDPFTREVDGTASLTAQRFNTGTLVLTRVEVGEIVATSGDLELRDGRVAWEGHPARVRGTIDNIDGRATVDLTVSLDGARVQDLIRSATGQPSPLYGTTTATLVVHSGGDLPRGGGYMDADVHLSDAILPLPEGTRGIYKDLVRIAPIARLDEEDRVHLEHMHGTLTLTRGVVHLRELLYESRIPVVVRGTIDAVEMDLYVRFVIGGDPAINPGRGLRLVGPLATPAVQWATRDELLPGWREARAAAREQARDEAGGRRLRIKTPRWLQGKKARAAAAVDGEPQDEVHP
jgi:hypothetical protein